MDNSFTLKLEDSGHGTGFVRLTITPVRHPEDAEYHAFQVSEDGSWNWLGSGKVRIYRPDEPVNWLLDMNMPHAASAGAALLDMAVLDAVRRADQA